MKMITNCGNGSHTEMVKLKKIIEKITTFQIEFAGTEVFQTPKNIH